MITLNLLPPLKKQGLQLKQLYEMIKNLITLILFITILVGIILLLSRMALQNHFNKIVEQTTLTTSYVRLVNKDIKEFNQYIKNIEKIQKDYASWLNFFAAFSKLLPADVGIKNLTINENKILINGLAENRAKLLELKKNIEESNLFSEVTIPLENLLKKEKIDFDIKATINLETLENNDD